MYAIMLAGGVGSRLWPRSRNDSPKQLIDLIGERTMIQETAERLCGLMPIGNIIIITGANHAALARQQLPGLPPENVLAEPVGRGTAPAIGLGLAHIRRLAQAAGETDPIIGSFHADHVITRSEEFNRVVGQAAQVAEAGYIVTLGITPSHAHTGYGYIERGEIIAQDGELQAYRVARFVEKPDMATAIRYLETGQYSWNSGMFIWKLSTIQQEYAQYLPELARQLAEISATYGQPDYQATLERVWPTIANETIDVGIAERSQWMAVLPADIGWSDVGDWSVVADLIAARNQDSSKNAVVARHIGLDTSRTLIYSGNEGKLIATIGLDDLIIVDLPDVLLIAPRSRNQEVKNIVERLKKEGLKEFL